jgi:hypothetical protein
MAPTGDFANIELRAYRQHQELSSYDATFLDQMRTPQELHELTETIGNRLSTSRPLRRIARSGLGKWKKYNEEIRPLALFVRPLVGREGILCAPTLSDCLNYDAVIDLPFDQKFLVEITSSKNGYHESLRNKVLNQVGHVCLTGRVTTEWSKDGSSRFVYVANETVTKSLALKDMQRSVAARIAKKAGMNYGGAHVLVVTFDDYSITSDEIEWLRSGIESEIDLSAVPFAGVYLVGLSWGTRCALLPTASLE